MKSQKQSTLDIPKLSARDGGYVCFFCGDRFIEGDVYFGRTQHHLNENRDIDELYNKVLAHNICNIHASKNIEWLVISQDKLKWNIEHPPTFEQIKMAEESLLRDGVGIMIDLNVIHSKICEEIIKEKLSVEPLWKYTDCLVECVWQCKQKTGHGSLQSIRNYVDVLCAENAPYEKVKIDGVTIIRKKAGM